MTDATDITPERFPGVLYDLASAGYVREAMELSQAWGGLTRDIPGLDGLTETSPLVAIVGMEAAVWLAGRHGPGRVYVPLRAGIGSKKRDILAHPGGVAETARALGTTEQWVRRVRNQITQSHAARAEEAGQMTIFEILEER